MSLTPTVLTRTVLAATSATLYTVPSGATAVVTNVVLTNTTGTSVTATIALDGVILVAPAPIPGYGTATYDLRQPLAATKTITGFAGTATAIACHIAGMVIA